MEQKHVFPDFSAWRERTIRTRSGLYFAPEDFYIVNEIGARKTYFTWEEAIVLEQSVAISAGWRLPTSSDWKQIVGEFKDPTSLRFGLDLGYHGCIWTGKMDEYNYNHDSVPPLLKGYYGCYWSSTFACGLVFNKSYIHATKSSCDTLGFSLRFVHL